MDELTEWLSNFYERFNNEVQLLLEKEPLWETCANCPDGYCCKKETIPVMRLEWDNIIRYVKSNFNKMHKNRFEMNVDKGRLQCPFLFRNRCAIYPVRPWSCRIYPYTISFYDSPITIQTGNFFSPYCPSLAPVFGLKIDETVAYAPIILDRVTDKNLAKIQIKESQSFWVVDITQYQNEYENKMPKNEDGNLLGDNMHVWAGFIKHLRDARKIDQAKFLELLGLD